MDGLGLFSFKKRNFRRIRILSFSPVLNCHWHVPDYLSIMCPNLSYLSSYRSYSASPNSLDFWPWITHTFCKIPAYTWAWYHEEVWKIPWLCYKYSAKHCTMFSKESVHRIKVQKFLVYHLFAISLHEILQKWASYSELYNEEIELMVAMGTFYFRNSLLVTFGQLTDDRKFLWQEKTCNINLLWQVNTFP